MPTFPATKLRPQTWIAPGVDPASDPTTWAWENITSDVLLRDLIKIQRGRKDEAGHVEPGQITLTLKNTAGKYTPRNPSSPYYGRLRKNTPLRVTWDWLSDAFGRTVSNGWGSADTDQAWSTSGGAAADYSVGSGVGKHSVGAVNSSRYTVTPSPTNVEITATVSTPALATGADQRAGLVARWVDASNHYVCWLILNTSGAIHLEIAVVLAGVSSSLALDTTTGLTHVANTQYRVKFQLVESGLRAKCWAAAGSEPADWNVTATNTAIVAATTGNVGLRSHLTTGNTNVLPVVFSYDNVVVTDVRGVGYVSEWPPRWDLSGNDQYVQLVADGVLRRLGQGAAPARSALTRGLAAGNNEAYWAMEDTSGATSFAEASGGRPLSINSVDLVDVAGATQDGLNGSQTLAKLSTGARLSGTVPDHTSTEWTVKFVCYLVSASTTDTPLCEWYTTGDPATWRITITAADELRLQAFDPLGNALAAFDLTQAVPLNTWLMIEACAAQSGGNVVYSISYANDAIGGGGASATDAGTVAAVRAIQFGASVLGSDLNGTSLGHLCIRAESLGLLGSLDDLFMHMAAEKATTRMSQLAADAGVSLLFVAGGARSDRTPDLGTQAVGKFLEALRDCEDTDGGILFEHRWEPALAYIQQYRMYNQTAVLALDYAAFHIAPPFDPTDDDQRTRNDVTVKRTGGSSARIQDTVSISDPNVGVGRYEEQVELPLYRDSDAFQHASWRVHRGTVDELRFPQVGLNLAATPALIPSWLRCDVGRRVTISNPPADLPPDQIDLLIEGYTETLGEATWDVVLNCSPARPLTVVKLNDSTLGRLSPDGATLSSSVTTTGTSLSVATPAGKPLWTTSGAVMPFDLEIGGERITVTAIAGAASPQTFTVTRSVNGVVKAHSSGAVVRLWKPAVLALV